MVNLLSEILKNKTTDKVNVNTLNKKKELSSASCDDIYLKCWICNGRSTITSFKEHINYCFDIESDKELKMDDIKCIKLFKTLNSDEQVTSALELLKKIVTNIYTHPNEERYKKLRQSNKTLNEKVLSLKLGIKLFEYLGFIEQEHQCQDLHPSNEPDNNERNINNSFLVFDSNIHNEQYLKDRFNDLLNLIPYQYELFSRNETIIQYDSKNADKTRKKMEKNLEDSMFDVDINDVKDQYDMLKRKNELAKTLLTSKQRQSLELIPTDKSIPLMTLLRFKLPDKTTIEAYFLTHETIEAIFIFLSTMVNYPGHSFKIFSTTNRRFYTKKDSQCIISQEGFYPNSTFHLTWDNNSTKNHLMVKK